MVRRTGKALLNFMGLIPRGAIGSGPAGIWTGYSRDAAQLARHVDCDFEALSQQRQHPERVNPKVSRRVCNWYIPVFDNPFYGGMMTILRLAAHLQEFHKIRQRFLICGTCDKSRVAAQVAQAFPALAAAEILLLDSSQAIQAIPASDYSVATLWTTAYVLLNVNNTGYKFYMIQDLEPLFYPAGSTSAQAEMTYRFGFYGIANTPSICEIYERDYGGRAAILYPSVDTRIFYPGPVLPANGTKRLFYYARPGTPRNGFELAAAALHIVKDRFGATIDIVCAGADWKPEDFSLGGIVRNVGLLPYSKTADLYRSCHVGLVMMMTKHPSYLPFELMACGCLVVSNINQANKWILKDGQNCLMSPPTVSCLAATLSRALDGYAEMESLRAAAVREIHQNSSNWDVNLASVAAFMHAPENGRQ